MSLPLSPAADDRDSTHDPLGLETSLPLLPLTPKQQDAVLSGSVDRSVSSPEDRKTSNSPRTLAGPLFSSLEDIDSTHLRTFPAQSEYKETNPPITLPVPFGYKDSPDRPPTDRRAPPPLPLDVSAANNHRSRPAGIDITHLPTAATTATTTAASPSPPLSMSRKTKSRSPNPQTRQSLSSSGSDINSPKLQNSNGNMNASLLEARRRHASIEMTDNNTAQTTSLMSRSSFSLDHDVPALSTSTHDDSVSVGFSQLPKQDQRNFLLLVLLYFLQGIPMGLAAGSVPFLLKSHLSYGQIGVYSLASYPYSLKLLWSPIVDAVWSTKVGRRKSWILPIQTLSGFGMIWLGSRAEAMMVKAGEDNGAGVWGFTGWWFALVFMCATQDIAVDGMYMTISSEDKTRDSRN